MNQKIITIEDLSVWSMKHLPPNHEYSTLSLEELAPKITLTSILEFTNFDSQREFIKNETLNQEKNLVMQNPENIENSKKSKNQENPEIRALSELEIIYEFKSFPLVWIRTNYSSIKKLTSESSIIGIYQNLQAYLCLNSFTEQFELTSLYNSFYKIDGAGVNIGLIDSGVDQSHPNLRNAVVDVLNLTSEENGDYNGHGSFMANLIAGNSGQNDSNFHGVAPKSRIYDIKIFDEFGFGTLADILISLDMILENSWKDKLDILVFGCTLGYAQQNNYLLQRFCEEINEKNILIIAPAGNWGPDPDSIASPGDFPFVLTVGAVDQTNKITFFSGRGKNFNQNPLTNIKPDIMFPGKDIISAKSLQNRLGSSIYPNAEYISLTGSSISAGLAAGFAALLLQIYPEFSPLDIIRLLKSEIIPSKSLLQTKSLGIPKIKLILQQRNKLFPQPHSNLSIFINAIKFGGLCLIGFIAIYFLSTLFY